MRRGLILGCLLASLMRVSATEMDYVIVTNPAAHPTNYFLGKTGIGTNAPAKQLHVVGDSRMDGGLTVQGSLQVPQQGDVAMGVYTNGVSAQGVISTNSFSVQSLTLGGSTRTNWWDGTNANPSFQVYNSAAGPMYLPTASFSNIQMNAISWCTGGGSFNTTNYRYTVGRTGWYRLTASLALYGATPGGVLVTVWDNTGSSVLLGGLYMGVCSAYPTQTKNYYLTNGAYIYVSGYSTPAGVGVYGNCPNCSFFQGEWLHY
jgi:hypothetical protein